MKSFRKGIAANYLESSDRLHAEKISNTCKKISNSMRKTVSTLFSSNSITWRKAHALPIERAEATHGKPNLMRLKVAKCVKILLLPPNERAVSVRKIYSLPTKESMRANGKKTITTSY